MEAQIHLLSDLKNLSGGQNILRKLKPI